MNILSEIKTKYNVIINNDNYEPIIVYLEMKKDYLLLYKFLCYTGINNEKCSKYAIIYGNLNRKIIINVKEIFHLAIITVYLNKKDKFYFIYKNLDLSINYVNKWGVSILHYILIYRNLDFLKAAFKLNANPYCNSTNEITKLALCSIDFFEKYSIIASEECKYKPNNTLDPILLKDIMQFIKRNEYSSYKMYHYLILIGYEYTIHQLTPNTLEDLLAIL